MAQPLGNGPDGVDSESTSQRPVTLTNYSATANNQAKLRGLAPVGTFADGKGRLYRVRYDFWLTPERQTLVLL